MIKQFTKNAILHTNRRANLLNWWKITYSHRHGKLYLPTRFPYITNGTSTFQFYLNYAHKTPTQGSHLHRFQNVALNLVVPAYSVWSPPKLKLSYFCTSRVFLSGEPPPVTCTLQKWKVSIARRWTQEENNCLPLWRVTSCCCKKGGISLPKTERRRWFWIAEEWVI